MKRSGSYGYSPVPIASADRDLTSRFSQSLRIFELVCVVQGFVRDHYTGVSPIDQVQMISVINDE